MGSIQLQLHLFARSLEILGCSRIFHFFFVLWNKDFQAPTYMVFEKYLRKLWGREKRRVLHFLHFQSSTKNLKLYLGKMPKFYSASQFTLLHHPLSHLIFTTTERKEDGIGTHILKARLLWETCMQVRKQQLEPGMKQWTASKLGKE